MQCHINSRAAFRADRWRLFIRVLHCPWGIKIDKSKCFDRIIPNYAGALMLAFGIPRCIVSIFMKLYGQLQKHLTFKSWFAATPTHGPNGVAQGCSLSLIAINVHMKAWVHFVQSLPEVCAQAYIDDAYLWTRLVHVSQLEKAMQLTQVWDELVGQCLNWSKCSVWGSSTCARKTIKRLFPQMQFVLDLEILGAFVPTSRKVSSHFGEQKLAKVLADIRNIGALPVATTVKAKLIGSKVVPQCNYCPSLNCMTQKMLSRIQGEIASVLWGHRPHWRSKWLVFALLTQTHRIEPVCARHYNTIVDTRRYLHQFPHEVHRFCDLLATNAEQNGTITHACVVAFRFFGLELSADGIIRYRQRAICHFLDLGHKEIRPILKLLAKQSCYVQATMQHRKDVVAPGGVLHPFLSTCFLRKSKLCLESDVPPKAFFEAQLVGCLLTNDRLAAAHKVESPQCRFCQASKECLAHLVRECPHILTESPPPPDHELGRNFELLGIVEHPWSILSHRLRVSNINSRTNAAWCDAQDTKKVWTDGSVMWPDHLLLTCAGFAVVDEHQNVLASGPVMHWSLCSFTAELWALLYAVFDASGPVHVHSDCLSLVHQTQYMIDHEQICDDWAWHNWWQSLFDRWRFLRTMHSEPLRVTWVPSHVLEGLPVEEITESQAQACRTTCKDIAGNRAADLAAKQAALANSPIFAHQYPKIVEATLERQNWLTTLCYTLGVNVQPYQEEEVESHDVKNRAPRDLFPALPWDSVATEFNWTMRHSWPPQPPSRWELPIEDWDALGTFVARVKWKESPELQISYAELAVLFLLYGGRCHLSHDEHATFRTIIRWLQGRLAFCRRKLLFDLHPGRHTPRDHNAWGKTMPSGVIRGAAPYFSNSELESLVSITQRLQRVSGQCLSTWDFPIAPFLSWVMFWVSPALQVLCVSCLPISGS